MMALLRVAGAGVVVILLVLVAGFWVQDLAPHSRAGRAIDALFQPAPASQGPEQALPSIAIGGPFSLTDQTGRAVTQESYKGKWLLVYFGYTTCPDICPTTLQAMAGALDLLGAKSGEVAPLFITVDPARDTQSVLARYTSLFDRRIIGLTGTAEQVASAESAYRVYAARAQAPGTTGYLMDHTSFIYLMSPKGDLAALFDHDVSAAALGSALAKHLK